MLGCQGRHELLPNLFDVILVLVQIHIGVTTLAHADHSAVSLATYGWTFAHIKQIEGGIGGVTL